MSVRIETFRLMNDAGKWMKYHAKFSHDTLLSVTKEGAKKPMALQGGKRLYDGAKADYTFASDIWGKKQKVHPKARADVAKMHKASVRRGGRPYRQKMRLGGRPTEKAPKKDPKKARTQKRTEQIIHRIQSIRDCPRKEAFKVYRYLKTVCAGQPSETTEYGIVKISRVVSIPEAPVTWLYVDLQSPTVLFDQDIPDDVDALQQMIHEQVIAYVTTNNIPVNYLRAVDPKLTYSHVIQELPLIRDLEDIWRQNEYINTDYMVLIGLAADDRIKF